MKKVAIVGFGFMGRTHTLNILRKQNLQLEAIVDKNHASLEENLLTRGNLDTGILDTSSLKKIRRYQEMDDCLEKEELDAILVCVHTPLHYEMTRKALLRGKHVFVEKPLTLNLSEGMELIRLAEKQHKVLMVGQVVRFMPPYQKLKELIDLKKFGKLKYLFLSRYSGTPDWGQWKEKQIAGASGGALMDLLIHDIDFTNYLLGAPDSIQSGSLPGRLSEQDYVNALWTYNEKNIKVRIEGGSIFHSQYPFQCGYTAVFEDATVIYHSHDGEAIKIADNRSLKEIPVESLMEGYKLELDYFARCMEQSTPPAECLPQSFMESLILACRHF